MDGNINAGNKPYNVELSSYGHSHPCALDPGNPCRDDGVIQALVYNDERSAWERENGQVNK